MVLLRTTSGSLCPRAHRAASIAIAVAAVLVATAGTAASAVADVTCDKVASKSGSDSGSGSASDPYRTPQKLVNSLEPGQTGCIRQGAYAETSSLTFNRGGAAGAPVTVRSYPGERAEIVAHVFIPNTSNHVTLTDLVVNGEGAPPCGSGAPSSCGIKPTVAIRGDDVTISNSEITNHNTAICVNAGYGSERAVRLTVQGNRIHHCGRLPATNYDHGVYLARTDDATVVDNLIYANADRGVQFYPEADNSYVARNVIDGNGSGVAFGGASGVAASHNLVEHNLITNSVGWNVYSAYPSGNPVGEGNVVRNNCIAGGGSGEIQSTVGFSVENNLFVSPQYTDRASGNFDLPADDPCKSVLEMQVPAGSDGTSGAGGSGTGSSVGSDSGTGGGDGVDTTITQKPKKKTRKGRATFRFEATVASTAFECSLDGRRWESCSSPTTYKVSRGRHRFRVRAVDMNGDGARDLTPATETWRVTAGS
jgi:hypothetical protein